ncbi:MAG TPA: bifunctional RNase H/acid phosphatase [Streptosporangiaceae bacterium]
MTHSGASGSQPRRLIVAADGGSRGNPGIAGYGAVVFDAATGAVLAEVREAIGTATNNVAEYSGLIAGLRAASEIAPGAIAEVRMDSKLVVEQMSGHWKIKHPSLIPLAQAAREAAGPLASVRYTWVPRELNSHADRLANEAMDSAGQPGDSAALSAPAEPRAAPRTGWRPSGQTATTTILLRHGETPLSIEHRFAGMVDVPLTETGLMQAKAAAAHLAARGGFELIVTSPLGRARQTAAEAALATGAKILVEDRLREAHFGEWEGLTFAEASEGWPDELATWLAEPSTAPPAGESFADVGRRVGAAIDDLLAAHPGQTVLVVSHVTPIKELVARALLAPSPAALMRMHLDVASLCEIDWYPDGGAILRSFNDTSHLHGT